LLALLDGLSWLFGYPLSPDFALASVRTARDSGLIWLLVLGFCVGAPIAEEFIFRGFLFRGWSATFLGPYGAIVLSAAVFAAIHQQYAWFYIAGILMVGLLFGYLRHRSGSTWLTVITHAFYNLMASLQALWVIG
jgi:membrane protease YdiL (CAAX protease family)